MSIVGQVKTPLQADVQVEPKRERVVFIELLRIIACFLVIVNHTNSRIFVGTTPSVLWFVSLSYFFISKIAVPIFIIISGYVMLDRRDDYRKTGIQFLRIGICLVLFSAVYYVSNYLSGEIATLSLRGFIGGVLHWPLTNAFWYLYLYLGIILMMPFLQKMVSAMEKKDFHVFFLISGVFFSFWPIAVHFIPELNYTTYFALPLFSSSLCLLLFGCYVKRYCTPAKKWRNICIVVFLLMCVLNVCLTYREYIRNGGEGYLFFDNWQFFPIVVASFCVFYIVSTLPIGEKAKKWFVRLGKLTFGIYLLSDFFIVKLAFVYNGLVSKGLYPMIAMLIFEVVVLLAAGIVVFALKQIPLIKKLI